MSASGPGGLPPPTRPTALLDPEGLELPTATLFAPDLLDDLDPGDFPLPRNTPVSFRRIADDARALLAEHNADTLRAALPALHEMIEGGVRARIANVGISNPKARCRSVSEALREYQATHPTPPAFGDQPAQWSSYFVLAALALVAHAARRVDGATHPYEAIAHAQAAKRKHLAGRLAVEASEALATARQLHAQETQAAQKLRARSRTGGKKRHARTNDALEALVAYWEAGDFKTYLQCAEHFVDGAPPGLIDHLSEDQRIKTLSEGLGALLSGKRKLD